LEKQWENLLLPFLLASVPKEKVAPKEKDFRPRYAKFVMQLLRLGSGEKPFTLSFSTMRKKVSKACPEHFTSFSTGSVEGKESPTPLYRPIITPQHLWLECYFFFVSSNKEKVTKKACPEQGRGETNCYLSFVRAKER